MKPLSTIPGFPPLIAGFGILATWEAAARLLDIHGLVPASEALAQLPAILTDPQALADIAASIRRMMIGFTLALGLAIPLGLIMGRSPIAANLLNPLLMLVYPIPKAALMPLIMLWIGISDASKILVILLGVALPVIYHSYQGARGVEQKLLWSAAAMGQSAAKQFVNIVIPASLPEILTGCRTGIVIALITMVTSEMIVRQKGIGNILFTSLDVADYASVYAAIVIIGIIGMILDALFEHARRALVSWSDLRDPFGPNVQ